MASSIKSIKAEIVRLLQTIPGIALVETSPASAEEWLNGFKDGQGQQTPAIHVSYNKEQEIKTGYTNGDFQDKTNFVLTGVYASAEYDPDEVITERDAILDVLCSQTNLNLSTLADNVDATGWGIKEQSGLGYTVWALNLQVQHSWTRAT